MKNSLTAVTMLCLWAFWSSQDPNPTWFYGGAFRTQAQCERNGSIHQKLYRCLACKQPPPPIRTICLPVGIRPENTGLFD